MADNDDYDVGYRKPPKHTQFQKGQSGNPNGRPKGRKGLKTDLLEVISEQVMINVGGTQSRVSKQRAMIMGLAQKALKGDVRANDMLLKLIQQLLSEEAESGEAELLAQDDQAIIDRYIADQQNANRDDGPEGNPQ